MKNYVLKYSSNDFLPSNIVPVSGKVIDSDEVCNLVESGLDMWFTTGRFNEEFETVHRVDGSEFELSDSSGYFIKWRLFLYRIEK